MVERYGPAPARATTHMWGATGPGPAPEKPHDNSLYGVALSRLPSGRGMKPTAADRFLLQFTGDPLVVLLGAARGSSVVILGVDD